MLIKPPFPVPLCITAGLTGLLLALAGCAQGVGPLPVCDLSVYDQARLAGTGPVMAPSVPGSVTPMPLNAVNIIDGAITSKMLPTATNAQRLPSGKVQVWTRLQNCTDYPLQAELRTHFYDQLQAPAEPDTAWTRLYLPPRSQQTYSTTSLETTRAALYYIEVREGP